MGKTRLFGIFRKQPSRSILHVSEATMSEFATVRGPASTPTKWMTALVAILLLLASADVQAQCTRYSLSWNYSILQPTAGSSFTQGNDMTIQWNYSYNPYNLGIKVVLHWSSNNGSTWNVLKNDIQGSTGSTNSYTWTIPLTQTPSTTYRIRVSEDIATYGCWIGSYEMNGPGTSGAFTILSRCAKPIITTQPAAASVCLNGSHTFTVASDMTSGTYEWKRDGTTVGVTTTPSFTLSGVTLADAGSYTATLTQNCNTTFFTTTNAAILTVNVPPSITVQPPPTYVVCKGTDDTLRADGIGIGKTYQWYKDGVAIAGATTANYIIRNAQATAAGSYYLVVSGTCSPPATSNPSIVSVLAAPLFVTEPTSVAVCPGTNSQLTAVVTGSNLTYMWYRNGVATGVTTANYPLPNYTTAMDGSYYVEARTNDPNPKNCPALTRSAIVTATGFRPPVLLTNPKLAEGCVGKSASLTSEFEGFNLSYSWTRNGSPVPNAASNSLLLSNLTMADAGDYVVTATATCGLTASSAPVRLNVVKPPSFSAQPQSKDVNVGDPLTLTIAASDATSIQWYKDTKPLAGQNSATLTIPSATMADAGYYYATVKNACSGISSAFARVTVTDPTTLQPRLTMTPETSDMGQIPLGYDATRTFTNLIQNTGTAVMQVSDISITGAGFAIATKPATPYQLAIGESSTITVSATAENLTAMTGVVTVTTDAPAPTGVLALTATPVLRYDLPAEVNYSSLMVSQSDDSCITVVNNSTTDITLEQATITGTNASMFNLVTPMPVSIAAGASSQLCVTFAPTSVGTNLTAQLILTSSTGGNTTLTLNGSATQLVGVSDLDPRTGVTVYPNPARDEVTIRTTGASTITIVNARGVKVATLSTTADKLSTTWNTKSSSGNAVAAGTYSVLISGQQGTVSLPLVIVR